MVLGCIDLDLALMIYRPPPLTMDSSTESKMKFERWDCNTPSREGVQYV